MKKTDAVVWMLLGQSNAVGHALPMRKEDIISTPLGNVFGLSREKNQTFDNTELFWEGYTSFGMNLAEEQDNTYSVANCLAAQWQRAIDSGLDLPDLYIIHIAIGAQGVTGNYMWNPNQKPHIIPGRLGTVDIALYPFTLHILSLLDKSFAALGKTWRVMGLHWRGGENDMSADDAVLSATLEPIYRELFHGFRDAAGSDFPIVLHRIVCPDRALDIDPTGAHLRRMEYINEVFDRLAAEIPGVSVFDVTRVPWYIPGVRQNGIFMSDAVHFTEETNAWVAKQILGEELD